MAKTNQALKKSNDQLRMLFEGALSDTGHICIVLPTKIEATFEDANGKGYLLNEDLNETIECTIQQYAEHSSGNTNLAKDIAAFVRRRHAAFVEFVVGLLGLADYVQMLAKLRKLAEPHTQNYDLMRAYFQIIVAIEHALPPPAAVMRYSQADMDHFNRKRMEITLKVGLLLRLYNRVVCRLDLEPDLINKIDEITGVKLSEKFPHAAMAIDESVKSTTIIRGAILSGNLSDVESHWYASLEGLAELLGYTSGTLRNHKLHERKISVKRDEIVTAKVAIGNAIHQVLDGLDQPNGLRPLRFYKVGIKRYFNVSDVCRAYVEIEDLRENCRISINRCHGDIKVELIDAKNLT